MNITINLLPVKEGDCIHIHFKDNTGPHNIIIDSGPSQTKRRFKALLEHIRDAGELVDLLCLSHIDDDHIKGAQMILEDDPQFDNTILKEVWFNIPPKTAAECDGEEYTESNYCNLSVDTAENLYKCLVGRKIPVVTEIITGKTFYIGEAVIDIISPDTVRHDMYLKYWDDQLKKQLAGYGTDPSKTNGDSIAFVLTLGERSYLFLGDAHAPVISKNLGNRFDDQSPVLVKMSHHGSKNNINKKLLNKLNARCFLISSKEDAERPSQETIDLLEQYKPEEEKWVYCNFTCDLQVENPDKLHLLTLEQTMTELPDDTTLYSEGYDD